MKSKYKYTFSIIAVFTFLIMSLAVSQIAYAGKLNVEVTDDKVFSGSEIDYANWRYDRNSSDIAFAKKYQVYSLNGVKSNSVELKSRKKADSKDNGLAMEVDFAKYDISRGASLTFAVGIMSDGASSSMDASLAQKKLPEKLDTLFFSLGYNKKNMIYDGVSYITNNAGTDFKDYKSLKINNSGLGDSGVMFNKTIRFYWNGDNIEISSREIGSELNSRNIMLTSSAYGSCLKGYPIISFKDDVAMDVIDFRSYSLTTTDTPISIMTDAQTLCKFIQEDSEQFLKNVYSVHEVNARSLYIGNVNKIKFSKTLNNENTLMNRNKIFSSKNVTDSFVGKFSFMLNEIVGNKEFGLTFGCEKINSAMGTENSSFFYFTKQGESFMYGLKHFALNEQELLVEQELIAPTPLSDNIIATDIILTSDNKIIIDINGERAFESPSAEQIKTEGYFGFGIMGADTDANNYIDIDIDAMKVENNYNDTPANSNIITKFDNNEYNLDEWYMRPIAGVDGGSMYIKDGKLDFNGAGEGGVFGTRKMYSNFDFRFDVSNVKNTPTLDENGNIVSAASCWFGICFGLPYESVESGGWLGDAITHGPVITVGAGLDFVTGKRTGKTGVSMIYENDYMALPGITLKDKYDVFKDGYVGAVTFRVLVIDGKLDFFVKLADELTFEHLFSFTFQRQSSRLGNIYLMSEGNQNIYDRKIQYGTYASFDNLIVNNWDEDANLVKMDYNSSIPKIYEDYNYVDLWTDDYLLKSNVTTAPPFKTRLSLMAIVLGALTLCFGKLITRRN